MSNKKSSPITPSKQGVILKLAELGKKVKSTREKKELAIGELSLLCNLSTVWVSKLERGMLENASLASLEAVLEPLGLSFEVNIKSSK